MKTTGQKETARVLSRLFTLSLLENILSHICGWIIKSVCVFSTLFQTHLNILAYSQYLQGIAEPVWDVKENCKAYIQISSLRTASKNSFIWSGQPNWIRLTE